MLFFSFPFLSCISFFLSFIHSSFLRFLLLPFPLSAFARSKGYSVVTSFTGHGVGLELHLAPNIFHHANNAPGKMIPGMTFTIGPPSPSLLFPFLLVPFNLDLVVFLFLCSSPCRADAEPRRLACQGSL
jgi:hypothetical protein